MSGRSTRNAGAAAAPGIERLAVVLSIGCNYCQQKEAAEAEAAEAKAKAEAAEAKAEEAKAELASAEDQIVTILREAKALARVDGEQSSEQHPILSRMLREEKITQEEHDNGTRVLKHHTEA